jgi:cytoskeletal protein CcmA (bactofilin family)
MTLRRPLSEPTESERFPAHSTLIDGVITGRICGTHVVLGSNANVDGDIVASAVTIMGRFRGQIDAESVHLRQSCNVEGTIRHQSLYVEMGAKFDGASQPHCQTPPAIGASA